jgi:hypothetical protein
MDTMNFTQAIVTIVSALIGGGLLTFIGDRLKRKDQKEDKNDEVTKKLDNMEKSFTEQIQGVKADLKVLSDSQAEKSAIDARRDILRFNDELLNNVDHSHEMFLQIMDDIATYDKYCADHDEFVNGRTVQSASNIKRTYERLFDSHKITS